MTTRRTDRLAEICARVAAECACNGLRRASRATSRLYETAFAPLRLTATQFAILVAVHLQEPIPLSRLAQGLVLDRTSLYRAVQPLERRGCLRIVPGRTARERAAVLTAKGRAALDQAAPLWEAAQRRFVQAVGPGTWSALATALAHVVPVAQASRHPRPAGGRRPRRAPA